MTRFHSHALIAWLLLALALVPRLDAQSRASGASLAPGDVLRLEVWRRPEFSGEFVIGPEGSIIHPLLQEVRVTGVPIGTVEERIRAFLTKYEAHPAFVISPRLRVFVGGQVRGPAMYTVPVGTTAGQAIALAGGPTEQGRLERVRLIRSTGTSWTDLTASAAMQPELFSGDQLFVSRRGNAWRDVIAPTFGVIGALAAIVNMVVQLR